MALRSARRSAALVLTAALGASPAAAAQKPPAAATQPPAKPAQKPPAKPAGKPPAKPAAKPATKTVEPSRPESAKPPVVPPGLTMRTTYTAADGQASETKLISNGVRQRVELGEGVAVITQCDTKQTLQINEKARVYLALPSDAPAASPAAGAKKGGIVEYASVTTPSEERKEIVGLSARRVTTIVTRTPGPGACDKKKERVQTEAWYAEVPVPLSCAMTPPAPPPSTAECRDEIRASSTGELPTGAPLAYTTTTFGDDGKQIASVRMEVKQLTIAPVDPATLDVPAGYTKADDRASFVAAVERAENEARWGAPKAAGVTRIGVVMPANKSGEAISMEAVEAELVEALTDAPFEAVPLAAATAAEQQAEAKARGCDYVVALDFASVKTSAPSKVGGLLRKASGGGSPTELHEAKVEYRMSAPGGPAVTKSASAKTGAFTWTRAVGVARFAARLYFGASAGMMRMMLSQGGGAGVLPAQNADPSLSAVSWVLNVVAGGAKAEAEEGSRDAAIAASIHHAAADILKDLAAKKNK